MDETDTIIITEEEAGERLDKVLTNRYRSLHSRTYFQNLLAKRVAACFSGWNKKERAGFGFS